MMFRPYLIIKTNGLCATCNSVSTRKKSPVKEKVNIYLFIYLFIFNNIGRTGLARQLKFYVYLYKDSNKKTSTYVLKVNSEGTIETIPSRSSSKELFLIILQIL